MRVSELLSEALTYGSNPPSELLQLEPEMLARAQAIYDSWIPDGNGLCEKITRAIHDLIKERTDLEVEIVGNSKHDYCEVTADKKKFIVDIRWTSYETYNRKTDSYRKKRNVRLTDRDLIIRDWMSPSSYEDFY